MNATATLGARGAFQHRPLLHPVVIGSVVLLVLNDHWLKIHHTSWATGKLSDVAFLVLMPLWLAVGAATLIEGSRLREGASCRLSPSAQRWILGWMIGGVGILFTAMQLTEAGDSFYRTTLGALQWPARALLELAHGRELPPLTLVDATPDPSDLICLPFLALAWWIGAPQDDRAGDQT